MEEKSGDLKKKVDESWKDTVDKEKHDKEEPSETQEIQVTFGLFVSGLMMEALVALGEVENPVTKKKEPSPVHAKFIIDTLDMLKAKTKNNLAKEEDEMLGAVLYDLRMRYVGKVKK